ncbi:MAG: GNAT family N-acetyltransferase [Actinobacteria bacterium]|nr:GNAT family N-acetyltransferase [Actinomycetota bacterium]
MPDARLRAMEEKDRSEVAELISASMNTWDILHGMAPGRFSGGPAQTDVFYQVYERLDPGHCVVAEAENGRLAGSCYYRERETHVALGIMNVHPNYFGKGIARQLLDRVIGFADEEGKTLRLVSSVMSLDSLSLYTRAGFVPSRVYQDLVVTVPEKGFHESLPLADRVRNATLDDVDAMVGLELDVSGISRVKDYRYFIENAQGFWHASVVEDGRGGLDGYLASIGHPLFNEIGPGVARNEEAGAALLLDHLNRYPGSTPLVLVPTDCAALVHLLYRLGGRNCEVHAAQARGEAQPFRGVTFPTFMPETG